MLRWHRSLLPYTVIVAAIFVAACGSEDSVVPPPDQICDERNPGGFSIEEAKPGHVYVWAGTGQAGLGSVGQEPGFTRLYWPVDVCFDPSGSPIVLDWNNHRVLGLDAEDKFVKLAGRNFGDPKEGLATEQDLNHPTHVCFTPDGAKMVMSAWHNSKVMEIDLASNWMTRYWGTGARGYNGEGNARLTCCLDLPVCAAFHPVTGELYISDQANHVIRRLDSSGVAHIVAGTAPVYLACNLGGDIVGYTGDGGPAIGARLHFEDGQDANPSGRFCFDGEGNIYIADTDNHAIRIVTLDGNIDTFAGLGEREPGYTGDGGPAGEARLREPRDVAMDIDGGLLIADSGNHVIRKVSADGTINTIVGAARPSTAVAISACALHAEHGASALNVHLTLPHGIGVDANGNVWIADTQNQVVRVLYR